MGRINRRFIFAVAAALIVITVFIGCDRTDKDGAAETTEEDHSAVTTDRYYSGYYYEGYEGPFPLFHDWEYPEWSQRTTWNFSFKIADRDERGIYITIYDDDYIGFYFNPSYYVLHIWRDGVWQQVTGIDEKFYNFDRMYSPNMQNGLPPLTQICIEYRSLTEELTAGKYRLTTILDSHEVFYEFELDENLDPVETPPTELE